MYITFWYDFNWSVNSCIYVLDCCIRIWLTSAVVLQTDLELDAESLLSFYSSKLALDFWSKYLLYPIDMLFLNKQRVAAIDNLQKVEREKAALLARANLLAAEIEAVATEREVWQRSLEASKSDGSKNNNGNNLCIS